MVKIEVNMKKNLVCKNVQVRLLNYKRDGDSDDEDRSN